MRRSITTALILTLAFVLLTCLGVSFPPLALAFHLIVGWFNYLRRVLPEVQVQPGGVAMALACLAGVLILGHKVAGWLWRETRGTSDAVPSPPPPWRFRWTLAGAAIVVLMFVSGIAAVGITHQSVWLVKSDQPLFAYRGRESANRVKCRANLKTIGQTIELYADEHGGRYPDCFEELLLASEITPEVFVCPSTDTDRAPGATTREQADDLVPHHCDYVYHGRGLTRATAAGRVIVTEAVGHHGIRDAGANVLFAGARVEWVAAPRVTELLHSIAPPPPATTRGAQPTMDR